MIRIVKSPIHWKVEGFKVAEERQTLGGRSSDFWVEPAAFLWLDRGTTSRLPSYRVSLRKNKSDCHDFVLARRWDERANRLLFVENYVSWRECFVYWALFPTLQTPSQETCLEWPDVYEVI